MRAAVVALAVMLAACARPGPPPGGEPDRLPPRVVSTVPEPLALVPALEGPVIIRFDERLSEQGIRDAVVVSPYAGEVRVERDGASLEVSVAGGWEPDRIYRVLVRPTVRDLFGNVRDAPVELVFSTGPEIPATTLAGVVTDRITGNAVEGARVEATLLPDSITYVGFAGAEGVFAMRNIPEGTYQVRAYIDQNRDRALDDFEDRALVAAELTLADTLLLALQLLARDTTAARLMRVDALDSLHLQATFDDYLDPEQRRADIRAGVWLLPDSTPIAVAEVLHPSEYQPQPQSPQPADTAAADTVAAAPALEPPEPQDTAAAAEPELPLPARELVIVLRTPLPPDAEYRLTIQGARNIAGLGDGGGSESGSAPAAPPA